jgi:hypothetical protein
MATATVTAARHFISILQREKVDAKQRSKDETTKNLVTTTEKEYTD